MNILDIIGRDKELFSLDMKSFQIKLFEAVSNSKFLVMVALAPSAKQSLKRFLSVVLQYSMWSILVRIIWLSLYEI